MKKTITFRSFMMAAFVAIIMAVALGVVIAPELSAVLHASPGMVVLGTFAFLLLVSFIPLPNGVALAAVYQEVWTGAVKEELTNAENATFLDGIEDYSRYVAGVGDEMQVIHLVYMGVQPDVLINNTTYPIDSQALDQEDIPISLDKYQTKVTPITDDELYALSYEKISVVKRKHARAIAIAKFKKSIHALAPSGNTTDMPVIVTTGDDDGTGRKKLTWGDLVTLKRKLDKLEIPKEGRRLVLCQDHLNDLLETSQTFKDQYYDATSGKVFNRLGFEFYDYVANPYYNSTTLAKLSFGATPVAGDYEASVFFSVARAAKATGWTKMYYSESSTDPDNQQNRVNFRHYFIVLPTQEDSRGAIVSAPAA
ncbi:hypothetical protein [Carboxylicivirga linearis]|uniref:Uncharacterized protein n=1 Tax=Carboxylicivirga linearis TaxID=1628157 RepID=A0ABS5K201_9BACT|nr:hypothetical protein [Carboxylicivirga linearis]MBS2100704.1 hypothetical protein [Carboxylicivirga linearis]